MLKLLALERMMNKRNVIDDLKNYKLILEARKSSEEQSLQKKKREKKIAKKKLERKRKSKQKKPKALKTKRQEQKANNP